MRKVTEQTVRAFLAGEKRTVGNTSTDGEELKLHGNTVAYKAYDRIIITMAGWATVTTRERINGVLTLAGSGWRVCQRDHEQKARWVRYKPHYMQDVDPSGHYDAETMRRWA